MRLFVVVRGLSSTSTAGILSETAKLPWIATIRGGVGFAIDRVMLYGTGGVAFVDLSDNINAAGFGSLFSAASVNTGWTIGAGVEAALAQNWTARVEYLFVQSNISLNGPLALVGGNLSYTGTLSDNIIRAGINFKYP
jgi:outer membrane immunogenic protein